MMKIALILLTGLLSAIVEIPKLIKNKSYKELFIFSVFLLGGVSLYVMSSLELLPSPSNVIAMLIGSMTKIKFSYQ